MGFRLNDGQQAAVMLAISWYYMDIYTKPLLAIAGLAGSGKSTVVSYIVKSLGISTQSVLYIALTGKAVSVLRMKGHLAQTVHKAFYTARVVGSNVYFNRKKNIVGNLELIVWDEFGMAGDSMIKDILSFGVPCIGLGDNRQLEPLFEKNTYLADDKLDIFLDEVMRTDDKSGILTIAGEFRNDRVPKVGKYGNSEVFDDVKDILPYSEYDAVLVWTNKTRRELNMIIREALGLAEHRYPRKGERVYFLVNRYDKTLDYNGVEISIVNGLDCHMVEDAIIVDDNKLRIRARPTFFDEDFEEDFDVEVSRAVFDGYYEYRPDTRVLMDTAREETEETEDMVIFADWSYCISVHASQGSEYGAVLMVDEMYKSRPEYFKWGYTAATRAKNFVHVLLDQ